MSGGYGPGGYPGQGYGDPRYEEPEYDQRGNGRGDPGESYGNGEYDDPRRSQPPADPRQRGYGQRGYGQQGYGQQGYDERGPAPRRPGPRDQRGSGNWGQDDSFLPGFTPHDDPRNGGRNDPRNGGRGSGPAPGRRPGPGYQDQDPRYRDPGYQDNGYQDNGYRGPGPGRPSPDPGPRGGAPGDPGGRDGDWDDDPFAFRKRRKKTRWIPRIMITAIVLVLVVGGVGGGLFIYHKYQARYHPADFAGPGLGTVTFQVKSGDTAFSMAPRLLAAGIIASDRALTNAAESGTTSGPEAGFYVLHHHEQASLVWAALINPKNLVQAAVTIPEGERAVNVIAIIAKHTKIPLKSLKAALADPAKLGLPPQAGGKVEGYLFPATYAIVPHETALQVLQEMVQRYDVEADSINIATAAKSAGLTPAQLIIEASLVQAEGGTVSDYPKIAEVINNRIKDGMPLQFDSAVLYGLGKYGTHATFAEIDTPGPYNIYKNKGLPVGPIDNPGDAAIQGILHPDHGDWLYFLTQTNGKNVFSATPLKGQ